MIKNEGVKLKFKKIDKYLNGENNNFKCEISNLVTDYLNGLQLNNNAIEFLLTMKLAKKIKLKEPLSNQLEFDFSKSLNS